MLQATLRVKYLLLMQAYLRKKGGEESMRLTKENTLIFSRKEEIMKRTSSIKGFFLLVAIGLVCGLFFTDTPKATAAELKPINIGVSMDFSGVTAQEGLQEFPAFEMTIKEANAAGGVNGRPIKLFVLDNGGDPTKTMGTLKVLKEVNGCVAIYYGINSVGGIAAKAWADQNHIPIVTTGPITDTLIQREGKAWVFRSYLTNYIPGEAQLMRTKEMGFKKIGLMGSTQAMGTDMLNFIEKNYSRYGLEFVGSVLCEPNSKDLTIQATRLRGMGPEVVINVNYPADMIVWARALKTIGWKPVSMAPAIIISICLGISPPDLYEDWQCHSIIDLNKPAVKMVWDKYEAYTKKRIEDDKAPRSWDCARLLLEAIKLGGNPDDPEAIREGFYKIKNFPIATGRPESTASFEIGRNHMLTEKDVTFAVVKSGKLVMGPQK